MIWSAAAVFTPLALLVALYARIAHLDRSIPFAILAVMLAAAFGAATEILTKREERPGLPASIALFATGALAALALALTFALEKGWLTIALALMSLGTAWISMQRPIPFLRSLAAILAGIVVLRIGYEPRIVGERRRHHADLQLAVVGLRHSGAVVLGRQHLPAPPRRRRAAARRWNRPRSCSRCCWRSWKSAMPSTAAMSIAQSAGLTEVALQVCVALAMAIGLERLRIRTGSIVHNAGAILLTAFAGARDRVRTVDAGNADPLADRCRRRLHQPAAARLRPARACWRCCCPMRWRAAARSATPTPSRQARWFSRSPM